ncbi:aminopeptidase [Feifania hominis]|uniref:Aminopeptidase n=1 Tax=Feifania hominis TaxID=2763660 RepID=A0A926HU87_9FIRM|nr:aminopeptidase [Feifania hominis]MBC8535685.1 aminopeptidase [Feifania hominis]
MPDKRWDRLGESLVNYSLEIKPGQKLMIAMYEVETYPLALAVYKHCIKAGGFPQIQFMSEALKHQVLKYGNEEQKSWVPEIEAYGMEWADCYIALRGAFNLNECYDIPNADIAKYQKAMGIISSLRWQKTRWALVRVPNERFAQQAGVDYEKIMDMFFDACFIDWPKKYEEEMKIAKVLEKGEWIRITGNKTDLKFCVKGNEWHPSKNTGNIPDGEIEVSPYADTVDGTIFFEFPATLGGRVIHNLQLTFETGKLVKVEADDNLDYVKTVLATDEGASKIGEFAFGTNPFIDVCTTDILIDEKMGGTIHIAMGRPYDRKYTSAIHWDIIKDTRTNSKIYLDDKLIFENGKFLIP